MRNKYLYSFFMLLLIGAVVVGFTICFGERKQEPKAAKKLLVVTSFYPMYVATQNLTEGISEIELQNLSEPQTGCLHDFQLTPEDMKLLAKADVFVVNGSGAESFLQDVVKEYPDMVTITATSDIKGVSEDVGMHAWMSPKLYDQEIQAIAEGLVKVCPKQKNRILKNANTYRAEVAALMEDVDLLRREFRTKKREHVILFSEAYEPLVEALDLSVSYLMDLDEERQISSGEVAEVMTAVNKEPGIMIFAEDPYGKNLGDMVMGQTNTPVVYLDTLTRGEYDKNRYVEVMKKNLHAIREALYEAD